MESWHYEVLFESEATRTVDGIFDALDNPPNIVITKSQLKALMNAHARLVLTTVAEQMFGNKEPNP